LNNPDWNDDRSIPSLDPIGQLRELLRKAETASASLGVIHHRGLGGAL
jgi:hypothetical protein